MSATQLAELVKSLLEFGTIEGSNQNEVYKEFAEFFDIKLGKRTLHRNVNDLEQKKEQTSFLDNLTLSLNQFLNRKNK